MDFYIGPEAVSAIYGFLGTIAGGIVTLVVSFHAQRKETERNRAILDNEIKKLQLSWNREDTVQSTQELKELGTAMAEYLLIDSPENQSVVQKAIQRFRATADQECSDFAAELSTAIECGRRTGAKFYWSELLEACHKRQSNSPK